MSPFNEAWAEPHVDERVAEVKHACGHTREYFNCSSKEVVTADEVCPECRDGLYAGDMELLPEGADFTDLFGED